MSRTDAKLLEAPVVFPDRIAWMKAAADKYPELGISKVGIIGGSAGGQSSTAALIQYNDFYKVTVADCGCHDNRIDKIWWNEAWMGWSIGRSTPKTPMSTTPPS